MDYEIAKKIASACDHPESDRDDKLGTTIAEIAKKLDVPAYKVAERLHAVELKLKKIRIEVFVERLIAEEDKAEAGKPNFEKDFYRITMDFETMEGESGGEEEQDEKSKGEEDDEKDDLDLDGGGDENQEDPTDIYPAFKGRVFTSAEEFNNLLFETVDEIGDSDMPRSRALKLMRSIRARKTENSELNTRIQVWEQGLTSRLMFRVKIMSISSREFDAIMKGIE